MKIRADFVTNSSSSSFCSIHIVGSKMAEIMNKYKELFESDEFEDEDLTISDKGFEYTNEEGGSFYGPSSEKYMARAFIDFISEFVEAYSEDPEDFDELIEELEENEDEINNTITTLKWKNCETGWGESESRYYQDYDDEFIRDYMGLDEDEEITQEVMDEFKEQVSNGTSQETTSVTFIDGKFEKTEGFDLM